MANWSKKLPFVLGLLLPSAAWAGGTAVVAPFVSKGVDAKVTSNVTGLVASELDFSGAFDTVNQLEDAPATLNLACLSSTSCLQGIGKTGNADAVITGSIGPGTAGVQVYIVYYDVKKNAIIRKKTYDVANEPSAFADKAGTWVKEITTGESAAAAVAADAVPTFKASSSDDDDMQIGGANPSGTQAKTRMSADIKPGQIEDQVDPDEERADAAAKAAADAKAKSDAAAQAKAASDAKAKADADARARAAAIAAQQAKDAADAKARADAQARAEAAAAAQAKADADARARADAQAKADAAAKAAAAAKTASASKTTTAPKASDDDAAFSFGSAASAIQVEPGASPTVASDDSSDSDTPAPSHSSSSHSSSGSSSSHSSSSDDELDLDAPTPSSHSKTASTSRSSSSDDSLDEPDTSSHSRTASTSSHHTTDDSLDEPDTSSRSRTSSSSHHSTDDSSDEPDTSSHSRTASTSSHHSSDDSSDSSDDNLDKPSHSRTASSDSSDDNLDDSGSSHHSSGSSSSHSRNTDDGDSGSHSSSSHHSTAKADKPGVGITGRVGYSRYYDFNFVTYGGELTVPISPSVMFEAGLEGFSTQRALTDKVVQQLATEQNVSPTDINAHPWNTILPFNLGIQYKATQTSIRPYVGADLTITPYSAAFDVAFGARARVGADFMVADSFGLNLNLSAGVMSGKNLEQTQPGTKNTGIIPQISGGTVFAF